MPKIKTRFILFFYEKEYIDSYEKSIAVFLRAAFERIFSECELTDKEILQVERVMTNYFRGHADGFTENNFNETDLISDLEIIYNGILQNFTKVPQ